MIAPSELMRQHRAHQEAMARWESLKVQLPERAAPDASGLTICNVAFKARKCVEINERLTRQLNPAAPRPTWLIFDNNTDPGEAISPSDPRFTVVKPARRDIDMGYEHALGISALLGRVQTRFALIQDPDCFLVMPDWLRRVPAYMTERGLGFFGTPINPKRHNSYRYFPYMVCMFVDLARVSPRDLCFLPAVWRLPTSVTYRMRKALAGIPKAGAAFRWLLTEQWKTNGWRIKEQFGSGEKVPFECAQPVWDVEREVQELGGIKGAIHALSPASVTQIPKARDYCSPSGFASMGAPDVDALGWEEFVWQGEPFAFHIGSVHMKAGAYLPSLEKVLDGFVNRAAAQHAS